MMTQQELHHKPHEYRHALAKALLGRLGNRHVNQYRQVDIARLCNLSPASVSALNRYAFDKPVQGISEEEIQWAVDYILAPKREIQRIREESAIIAAQWRKELVEEQANNKKY